MEETAAAQDQHFSSSPPRRPGADIIAAVMAGVSTAYEGTHSILITIIAALAAVALAAVVVFAQR